MEMEKVFDYGEPMRFSLDYQIPRLLMTIVLTLMFPISSIE